MGGESEKDIADIMGDGLFSDIDSFYSISYLSNIEI